MFWRFGGYANISTIDTILDKPDVTLEELLDESDLIQELKQHNTKLIEYLREDKVLERLLEYVVAPKLEVPTTQEPGDVDEEEQDGLKGKERSFSRSPTGPEDDEDEREKKRNRYAYVAAEILSSENWSISESLMENQALLRKFWGFLNLAPPLDPLQASYFTKVNESLLDKKTEEMLDLFKSLDGPVKSMLQHVDSPMVMDLLLKIISLEKAEGGQGIVDWLHSQDLMPILLSFLSSEHSWATQTSAGDFLKAIITISANASQNEQSCIGPNELTRQLVSQPCIEKLISDMLKGGNPLTVGVGIVIEVIRKNNSDYDPDVGAEANAIPSSRDPIYLGTLLRMFAQHVPDFMELILSPNHTIGGGDGPVTIRRKELGSAFGGRIEPLGFDRFKTCELMAELLHCSNMGLLNEIGSEEFVKARDIEREKLKAEGRLAISPSDTHGSIDDDLTMRSSTHTRLGSPDGSRKLEVQNATEDDGFEEVTHATDLGDDAKDDFDEKPEPDEDLLMSNKTPLSFLDKDDEEFVDEPLSSPRINPATDVAQLDLIVQPLSPSKELSQQVSSLGFEEDTTMTSLPPPPSIDTNTTDDESNSSKASPESLGEPATSPLRIEVEKAVDQHIVNEPTITQEPLDNLPHPEDKPAPLFAKKSEPAEEPSVSGPVIDSNISSESVDTTMGEAGDSSNLIHMGNTEDQPQPMIEDSSPTPVVGDFLKMQFVEHKVVPTILVFNGPMDRGFNRSLSIDLFETGDITMRIVDGQKKSDEAQASKKMRLGYMGHLTLIAEEVVKFTERHPPELLAQTVLEKVMNGEWITYVEITLAETRERDNAILGGVRPDMSVGPRQAVMNAVNAANNFGASSVLADAGLNGSIGLDSIDLANGNGTSGFSLSGGTLLSGFGSSSDEEDDEMDEDNDEEGLRNHNSGAEVGHSVPPAPKLDKFDDEDVDYEYLEQLDRETPLFPEKGFSRYISSPLTTTATSTSTSPVSNDLSPPSQPPPPPPASTQPSRARRQLAARLALHSKQQSASAENGDSDERKIINPFATDEDDEEEEEDGGDRFMVGDLEAEEEGKGHLPAGTAFVGSRMELEDLGNGDEGGENLRDNVNVGFVPPVDNDSFESAPSFSNTEHTDKTLGIGGLVGLPIGRGRVGLSSLWPFGLSTGHKTNVQNSYLDDEDSDGEENEVLDNGNHFRGTDHSANYHMQTRKHNRSESSNSDIEDDSPDEDFEGRAREGNEDKVRRLSVTEAKRRTSLDDEEDYNVDVEGVVHVKMDEVMGHHDPHPLSSEAEKGTAREPMDDEELVEIQHAAVALNELE
ncbi:hypothetical protein B7494_g5369 [Chlorociboria aeruginascens]|nr:hypothetical protein B7494_g5369 [Chlorociboria aeruginascens]